VNANHFSDPMLGRRERILAAAREIIADRGYQGLTMRDLAAASRVTVPTLYNLIGGKDAVLFAAVEEQTERFVRAIESSRGGSPAAGAIAVVDASVRELLRLPRYYRTLLRLLQTSDAAEPASREVNRALSEQFARAIEALGNTGDLAAWVDHKALADRLGAHLGLASLQWAAGAYSAETFRAVALFDASTTLLGVTQGASQRELQRVATRAQRRAAPGKRTKGRRREGVSAARSRRAQAGQR
jgi:AcrR family transcriptional regulator